LLLLDEPANALDLAHQVSTMQLLAKLCREQGKTAVTIGHDLNLAQQACSHVLLMMGNGAWDAGPLAEVMTAEALGRYLGHPIEIVVHGGRRIFIPVQDA
jgi:iron complex transport system ATP-binding protein